MCSRVVSIVFMVGLDFQGMGVFRSDEGFERFLEAAREDDSRAAPLPISAGGRTR